MLEGIQNTNAQVETNPRCSCKINIDTYGKRSAENMRKMKDLQSDRNTIFLIFSASKHFFLLDI